MQRLVDPHPQIRVHVLLQLGGRIFGCRRRLYQVELLAKGFDSRISTRRVPVVSRISFHVCNVVPRRPQLIQDKVLRSKTLFEPLETRGSNSEGPQILRGQAVSQLARAFLCSYKLVEVVSPVRRLFCEAAGVVSLHVTAGGQVNHKLTVFLELSAHNAPRIHPRCCLFRT